MLIRHEPQRTDVNGKRHYQTPHGLVRSVTTILDMTADPAKLGSLASWRRRVGEAEARRITAESAARGTALHEAAEHVLTGAADPDRTLVTHLDRVAGPALWPWWPGLRREVSKVEPLIVEGAVWHSAGYAGTVDCLGFDEQGRICVFDWKNGRQPKQPAHVTDYYLQVAAYALAVEELYGLRVGCGKIVVALADRPAQVFDLSRSELDQQAELWLERVKVAQGVTA